MNTAKEFWSAVNKSGKCWIWKRGTAAGRYGSVKWKGRQTLAHRLAWELKRGKIPRRLKVLHKCDVGFCVRLGHLFLGTQLDNVRDMHAKGRAAKAMGEQSGASKLTTDKVLRIRKLHASGMIDRLIAVRVNISRANVNKIRNRKLWSHIP